MRVIKPSHNHDKGLTRVSMHEGGTPSKEDPDAKLEKGVGSITVPCAFLDRM
jgi:hypothetical protein